MKSEYRSPRPGCIAEELPRPKSGRSTIYTGLQKPVVDFGDPATGETVGLGRGSGSPAYIVRMHDKCTHCRRPNQYKFDLDILIVSIMNFTSRQDPTFNSSYLRSLAIVRIHQRLRPWKCHRSIGNRREPLQRLHSK